MKYFLTILTILGTVAAHAETSVNCVATKVYDTSFLEESLSVKEHYQVSATQTEANLGSSLYSAKNQSQVVFGPANDETQEVIIIDATGEVSFLITVSRSTLDGKLYGAHAKDHEPTLIADLACQEIK